MSGNRHNFFIVTMYFNVYLHKVPSTMSKKTFINAYHSKILEKQREMILKAFRG